LNAHCNFVFQCLGNSLLRLVTIHVIIDNEHAPSDLFHTAGVLIIKGIQGPEQFIWTRLHLSPLAVMHVLVVDGLFFLELVEEVDLTALVAASFVFFK